MPSTTETSADDDDEEDAGLWLFSQAGQKEPDEDVQVERLTERHVQDVIGILPPLTAPRPPAQLTPARVVLRGARNRSRSPRRGLRW